MMSNDNNLHAAMERAMQSGDMGIRPMAKEDDGPIGKQVLIRTTDSDRALWKEAASAEGVTLSSWIRTNLNNAAKTLLECEHPANMTRFYPWATICTKCGKRLVS
jgi:hypothetical protein